MQTRQLESGYSDLLRQFKGRTRTPTDIEKLNVIFYFEDGYDLVAVENDSEHVMVLAIYNLKTDRWRNELTPSSPAREMIEDFCKSYPVEDVPKQLNDQLETYTRQLF